MLLCDLRIKLPTLVNTKGFCVFLYSTEPAILYFSTVVHIVLLHSTVVAGHFLQNTLFSSKYFGKALNYPVLNNSKAYVTFKH